MKTVKTKITYRQRASRLELFVRMIYSIPLVIVLWIFGMIAGVSLFLNWFHILIFAKRHKTLSEFVGMYVDYSFKVHVYLYLLTDERPPIIPEK